MSSRKKSTSTEESSSGSSSNSSSTSGGSGGSSTGSESNSSSTESESSSSRDEKTGPSHSRSNDPSTSGGKVPRRRSSETKQYSKTEDKSGGNAQKRVPSNRGQRLSKSSVYSSDDDISPPKKLLGKNLPPSDRRRISEVRKSTHAPPPPPPIGGGKAPPAIVKQQQQQNFIKAAANRQNLLKAQAKPQPKSVQSKKKSIFSPENSSDSEEEDDKKTSKGVVKGKQPPKPKARAAPQRKTMPIRKEDSKSTGSSECSSSSGSSNSSTETETESTDDSSPPAKRPAQRKVLPKSSKATESGKTVILSDSDPEQTKPTVRKLTRSSSTRKSKHLTGKATDSESEVEQDKRSISKSPVKKAPIGATKCKAKVKREIKATTPVQSAASPVPEEQKCPVEGCDSSGHLSGNLDKHFLPEACPLYHNMSVSECKERADERRLRDEDNKNSIALYDPNKKPVTPEQKAYLTKIRESRFKFKPPQSSGCLDKIKPEKADKDREPNLIGVVPDYDLQLFREAQALASEKVEKEVKDLPVGKGIKYITMGKFQMKVWYQSPYPEDAARLPKMYICEFCLRYQKSEVGMKRHAAKCVWRHPPGDEIYRKGKLQVWQVDGKRHKQYCQHLCLLAKFFLDHKTLYYDVEPFLFYVMTLFDSEGCHTVGYFSKEKNSFLNYNVSCILTLPPYQRKGYGRLLIDFSYLLTRVEGKIGSPEKPLSDLGLISYRSYWKDVLLDYLCKRTGTTLSIKDVSQEMAIYSYDIVSTLQALGMMKYWKGKHIVLKKQDVLEEFEERVKRRGNFPKIDPACLRWSPFVPPQSSGSS